MGTRWLLGFTGALLAMVGCAQQSAERVDSQLAFGDSKFFERRVVATNRSFDAGVKTVKLGEVRKETIQASVATGAPLAFRDSARLSEIKGELSQGDATSAASCPPTTAPNGCDVTQQLDCDLTENGTCAVTEQSGCPPTEAPLPECPVHTTENPSGCEATEQPSCSNLAPTENHNCEVTEQPGCEYTEVQGGCFAETSAQPCVTSAQPSCDYTETESCEVTEQYGCPPTYTTCDVTDQPECGKTDHSVCQPTESVEDCDVTEQRSCENTQDVNDCDVTEQPSCRQTESPSCCHTEERGCSSTANSPGCEQTGAFVCDTQSGWCDSPTHGPECMVTVKQCFETAFGECETAAACGVTYDQTCWEQATAFGPNCAESCDWQKENALLFIYPDNMQINGGASAESGKVIISTRDGDSSYSLPYQTEDGWITLELEFDLQAKFLGSGNFFGMDPDPSCPDIHWNAPEFSVAGANGAGNFWSSYLSINLKVIDPPDTSEYFDASVRVEGDNRDFDSMSQEDRRFGYFVIETGDEHPLGDKEGDPGFPHEISIIPELDSTVTVEPDDEYIANAFRYKAKVKFYVSENYVGENYIIQATVGGVEEIAGPPENPTFKPKFDGEPLNETIDPPTYSSQDEIGPFTTWGRRYLKLADSYHVRGAFLSEDVAAGSNQVKVYFQTDSAHAFEVGSEVWVIQSDGQGGAMGDFPLIITQIDKGAEPYTEWTLTFDKNLAYNYKYGFAGHPDPGLIAATGKGAQVVTMKNPAGGGLWAYCALDTNLVVDAFEPMFYEVVTHANRWVSRGMLNVMASSPSYYPVTTDSDRIGALYSQLDTWLPVNGLPSSPEDHTMYQAAVSAIAEAATWDATAKDYSMTYISGLTKEPWKSGMVAQGMRWISLNFSGPFAQSEERFKRVTAHEAIHNLGAVPDCQHGVDYNADSMCLMNHHLNLATHATWISGVVLMTQVNKNDINGVHYGAIRNFPQW